MKKIENNRPRVGLGVCVYNPKGELLFHHRKGAHGAGTWAFPGGHLEFGESWEKCAKRETYEETGVRIKNLKFIGTTNDIMRKENKHYITIYMRADWKSGQARLMEKDKDTDVKWFKPNKLPKPLFLPIKNFLKENKLEE